MYVSTQYLASSCNQCLLALFKQCVAVINLFPSTVATCLFGFTKVLFVSLLAFSVWVRNFSNAEFGTWLAAVICFCLCVHAISKSTCEMTPEKSLKLKEDCSTKWLEHELKSQKSICDALEHVRAALTSKSILEEETGKTNEHLKARLLELEQFNVQLNQEVQMLRRAKDDVEMNLERKRHKLNEVKGDFKRKVVELEEAMHEVQMEKNKIKTENGVLSKSLELVKQRNEELSIRLDNTEKHVILLGHENSTLSNQLATHGVARSSDLERIRQLQTMTQRLQHSLSSAKGKLTKVGGMLGADTSLPAN
uniref:Uncharacterized LOC100184814 n=1 Tax=Ciona intestinalis TaxID=7719 RepID=F6S8Z7_CIOIN|nr:uncharacterized protein LOC100184814 [Ciona intestinalis]|eukprot:XP_002129046.1 uncharacterized protein LOC100184814 [Ciona intestinalis]